MSDVDIPRDESVDPPARRAGPGLPMVGPVALPDADAVDRRARAPASRPAGRGSGSGPTPTTRNVARQAGRPGLGAGLPIAGCSRSARSTPRSRSGRIDVVADGARRSLAVPYAASADPTSWLVVDRTSARRGPVTVVARRAPRAAGRLDAALAGPRPRSRARRRRSALALRAGRRHRAPAADRRRHADGDRPTPARVAAGRPATMTPGASPTHPGEHHVPLDFLKRRKARRRRDRRGAPPDAATRARLMPEEVVAQDHQLKLYYAGKSSEGVRMKAGPKALAELPTMLDRAGPDGDRGRRRRCRSSSARRRPTIAQPVRGDAVAQRPPRPLADHPARARRPRVDRRGRPRLRHVRLRAPRRRGRHVGLPRVQRRSSAASRRTGTRRPAT